jgi:hypothetical protein
VKPGAALADGRGRLKCGWPVRLAPVGRPADPARHTLEHVMSREEIDRITRAIVERQAQIAALPPAERLPLLIVAAADDLADCDTRFQLMAEKFAELDQVRDAAREIVLRRGRGRLPPEMRREVRTLDDALELLDAARQFTDGLANADERHDGRPDPRTFSVMMSVSEMCETFGIPLQNRRKFAKALYDWRAKHKGETTWMETTERGCRQPKYRYTPAEVPEIIDRFRS